MVKKRWNVCKNHCKSPRIVFFNHSLVLEIITKNINSNPGYNFESMLRYKQSNEWHLQKHSCDRFFFSSTKRDAYSNKHIFLLFPKATRMCVCVKNKFKQGLLFRWIFVFLAFEQFFDMIEYHVRIKWQLLVILKNSDIRYRIVIGCWISNITLDESRRETFEINIEYQFDPIKLFSFSFRR